MADRTASVTWKGSLMDGWGTIERVGSGAFGPLDVTWASRAEDPDGRTSPEELIAAAHAACFSMALSAILGRAGMTAESIGTKATVTLEKVGEGFAVTASHLDTTVSIPGADKAAFAQAVEAAKTGCPISKLLNAPITMDAKLL